MTRPFISTALFVLTLAAPASSADLAACQQPLQAAVGRKARVTLQSGSRKSGKIVRFSADALVLRSHGEERPLEAADIDRIEIRSGSNTARNILISVGAGALAGVLFGAAYDEADSDSLAIIFGLIGAGGGAGVGAALPGRTILCD